jgi:hypothetical protein
MPDGFAGSDSRCVLVRQCEPGQPLIMEAVLAGWPHGLSVSCQLCSSRLAKTGAAHVELATLRPAPSTLLRFTCLLFALVDQFA